MRKGSTYVGKGVGAAFLGTLLFSSQIQHHELKRGTPPRKRNRGRIPGYTAKRGQEAYTANRRRSKRPCKIDRDDCEPFIQWMCERIRKERWSIGGCVGAARLKKLFPEGTIPCTKTLYNMLWANKLPLSLFDLFHVLDQKKHRKWNCKNKRMLGRSIEERPGIANAGTEIGHWEVDTVVGRRQGREAVIFTAVEKVLRAFIAIRIPGRTSAGVEIAMTKLREEFGDEKFSKVFKTMTADNGRNLKRSHSMSGSVQRSTSHTRTAHGNGLRTSGTTAS